MYKNPKRDLVFWGVLYYAMGQQNITKSDETNEYTKVAKPKQWFCSIYIKIYFTAWRVCKKYYSLEFCLFFLKNIFRDSL